MALPEFQSIVKLLRAEDEDESGDDDDELAADTISEAVRDAWNKAWPGIRKALQVLHTECPSAAALHDVKKLLTYVCSGRETLVAKVAWATAPPHLAEHFWQMSNVGIHTQDGKILDNFEVTFECHRCSDRNLRYPEVLDHGCFL